MLDNERSSAWAKSWFMFDSNSDPTMPVLATDKFRGLIKPILENQ